MIRYDFDFKDQQTYIKALIEDLKSLIIWSPVLKRFFYTAATINCGECC